MADDADRVPWTPKQVAALNAYQRAGQFHPFTCGGDGCRAVLVATPQGWTCPACDYTQSWAHPFMMDAAPAAPWIAVGEPIDPSTAPALCALCFMGAHRACEPPCDCTHAATP